MLKRRWLWNAEEGGFYRDSRCVVADMKRVERHWWWMFWNPWFWTKLRQLDEEWSRVGRDGPDKKEKLDQGEIEVPVKAVP